MNDEFKLYHGDCIEIMKSIEDKSIDLILCDLPYGTTQAEWDSIIPYEDLWNAYERIIKDNGCICLFSQPPFNMVLGCSNLKLFRYEWIWHKTKSTGHLNANKMPMKAHENILVFYKKLPTFNPQMRIMENEERAGEIVRSGKKSTLYGSQIVTTYVFTNKRYPTDVLTFSKDRDTKYHPTQKPLDILAYFIKTYTNAGDLVLDNCMGSGNTGIACAYNGRKFIGIEKNDSFYKIAEERVTEAFKNRIPDELFES